jgi:hypothetical protein
VHVLRLVIEGEGDVVAAAAGIAGLQTSLVRSAASWSEQERADVARAIAAVLALARTHKAAIQLSLDEQSRGRRAVAGYRGADPASCVR